MKLCHVACAFKAVDISILRAEKREKEKVDMGVSGANYCLTHYMNEKRKNQFTSP